MPTLQEIKSEINKLPNSPAVGKERAVKELPHILHDDEHIGNIIHCMHGNRSGIFIATNQRVIFVDKGLIYGVNVDDVPYDEIVSVRYRKSMLYGGVIIYTSDSNFEVNRAFNNDAADFCEYVKAKISE